MMETRPEIVVHCVKNVPGKKNKFKRHVKSLMSSTRCPVCSWLLFFEGNGLAETKEGDSKDTLACDDDAHKVDVCT